MKKKLMTLLCAVALSGCSAHRVDDIKAHAKETWENAGFEIIGYEGYELGSPGPAWGGKVWYIVTRKPSTGVTYHGFIAKWGNEYHIYDLKAIDAVSSPR